MDDQRRLVHVRLETAAKLTQAKRRILELAKLLPATARKLQDTAIKMLAICNGVGVTHLNPGTHLFHDVIPDWLLTFVSSHVVGMDGARP